MNTEYFLKFQKILLSDLQKIKHYTSIEKYNTMTTPNIPYAIPVETSDNDIRKFEVLLNIIKTKVFSNSDSLNNIHTSISSVNNKIYSASLEKAATQVENAANSISIFKEWNLKVERAKMELYNPDVFRLIVNNEESSKQYNRSIQTTFIVIAATIVSYYYYCRIYNTLKKD